MNYFVTEKQEKSESVAGASAGHDTSKRRGQATRGRGRGRATRGRGRGGTSRVKGRGGDPATTTRGHDAPCIGRCNEEQYTYCIFVNNH